MTARLFYRIAAVLLVLFAAGHTMGFLTFVPSTAEGVAVRDAMNTVHFQGHSYGSFYKAFGLFISIYQLFFAYLAWHLGGMAANHPQAIGPLGWVFFAIQLAGVPLGWIYVGAPPTIVGTPVVICLGLAAWKTQRTAIRQVSLAAASLS